MVDPRKPMGSGAEREGTDPFTHTKPEVHIPILEGVPETREEIRRRFVTRVSLIVLAVVVAVAAVVAGILIHQAAELADAVDLAGDDGRASHVEAALAMTEGDGDADTIALRARLFAAQALEHASVDPERARAELAELDPDEPATMNALAAVTYLALLSGDVETAEREASRIVVAGSWKAEAARARALAAIALGNAEGAATEAQLAVEERPGAARHATLLALIKGFLGDVDGGLAVLARLGEAQELPVARLARARLLAMAHRDAAELRAAVDALVGSEDASPAEKAWGHVLRATLAAREGDGETVRAEVALAQEGRPTGDVAFTLWAADSLLRVSAYRAAAEEVARLPADARAHAGHRALTAAELALGLEDLPAADAALAGAPAGPRAQLLRARLADARGRRVAARQGYERAAADDAMFVQATFRLAAIELEAGEARAASTRLARALERAPTHPAVVTVAAKTRVALGDASGAMELVTRALEAHPENAQLLAARGRVQMATDAWSEALASLRAAIERQEDDPDLHADRAWAARRVGELEEARSAYDRAVELNDRHREALVGSLELAVIMGDEERARRAFERIEELDLDSDRILRAKTRFYVLAGTGQRSIGIVRGYLRRFARDPVLLSGMGDLFRQVEDFRQAINSYGAALTADPEFAEARLGRAISQIRLGAGDNAIESLAEAERLGEAQGLGPAYQARVIAARGRVDLMGDRLAVALAAGERAVSLDPKSSDGHLLLADVATARENPALPHLRAALEGREALPEVMARVAIATDDSAVMCNLSRRYLRAAPTGRWAERMRNNARRCR